MPPSKPRNLNKNVSPNWKPVAALEQRKPGMAWSDRVWYWLVSLGGLALIAWGVLVMAYLHLGRMGAWLIGIGFVVLILGSPSRAVRNGYRID